MLTLQDLSGRFDGVKWRGRDSFQCLCPAHIDKQASLTVSAGDKGLVLYCHSGCRTEDILGKIGLRYQDIMPERDRGKPVTGKRFDFRNIVASYEYRNGTRKLRDANKNFLWQHREPDGTWKAGRGKAAHVLYQAGEPAQTIFLLEGEKDCDNAASELGLFCVSAEDGAGSRSKWHDSYTRELEGKDVLLVPDNDEVGRKFCDDIAAQISTTVKSLRIIDLRKIWPEIPEKGDISDLIDRYKDKTADLLRELEQTAEPWTPITHEIQDDDLQRFKAKPATDFEVLPLETDRKGNAVKTIENFYRIFTYDPFYASVRFNELTNSAEMTVTDRNGKQIIKQMDDSDDAASMRYCQSKFGLYQPAMHEAAIKLLLRDRRYNPIIDLVNSFEWDGKNRIEFFLHRWMKVEDSPYSREVSRLIFAGGINRLYNPGCKFDDCPVLIGTKQGEGKSTIIEWLALNSTFSKVIDVMDGSQKSIENLSGVWIGEIAELSAFKKSDIEALKSFITRTADQYRPPYGRKVTVLPRRCIFIGTTNTREFLTDRSGNRRFYPVEVCSNGYDLWQQEDEVRAYIAQCWAEARERYKQGTIPPYANRALTAEYHEAQSAAEIDDWRFGVTEKYLASLPNDYPVCIKELFKKALYPDSVTEPKRGDQIEIAQIMDKIQDWERCEKREQTRDYGRQRCWKRKSVHSGFTEITQETELPF